MAESQKNSGKNSCGEEKAVQKRGRGRPKKQQAEIGNFLTKGGEDAASRGKPDDDSPGMADDIKPTTQGSGKTKPDGPKPTDSLSTKQCRIILPLKKNEYSVPALSGDGAARAISSSLPLAPPKEKDGLSGLSVTEQGTAEERVKNDDSSEEGEERQSRELQTKKKARGRLRKSDDQQRSNVDTAAGETVAGGFVPPSRSGKVAEPCTQGVHLVEASDSARLVDEPPRSGRGAAVKRVRGTALPPGGRADGELNAALDGDANTAGLPSEKLERKGRGRQRKNVKSARAGPPTDSVRSATLEESVQTVQATGHVEADCVHTASPQPGVVASTDNSASQFEGLPKKRGRGRPPRSASSITQLKVPQESKEPEANQVPPNSTVCKPAEKETEQEKVGNGSAPGDPGRVGSVQPSKKELCESNQSVVNTAQLELPTEDSNVPAAIDGSERGPPKKKTRQDSEGSATAKAAPKKGHGRLHKNVVTKETAAQLLVADSSEDVTAYGGSRSPSPAKRGQGRPRKKAKCNFIL